MTEQRYIIPPDGTSLGDHSVILHLDMDCFFAACEVRRNPGLKGKPLVIGADPKEGRGRGVVCTASYEARTYGIHSAQPISQAYKACPDAIFLPVDGTLYRRTSRCIMQIVQRYGRRFEIASIDEAYLDITGLVHTVGDAKKFAMTIKDEIMQREGLSCSIGIGPNRKVAKVASDYNKPDGYTVVPESCAQSFFAPLDVRKIPGIGPKSAERLAELGIFIIGDIATKSSQFLLYHFGTYGAWLDDIAHGRGSTAVGEEREVKSISRERTFESDTDKLSTIYQVVHAIAPRIADEVEGHGLYYTTVSIKLRFDDFTTLTRARTLDAPCRDVPTIRSVAWELLKPLLRSGRKVRLVGVRISNFEHLTDRQAMLTSYLLEKIKEAPGTSCSLS